MKILITGANGQLGRCLQDRVTNDFIVNAVNSDILDITNKDALDEIFSNYSPNVVINAAAYTAVDKAEIEGVLSFQVNAKGPEYLAKRCASYNIPIIHVSTDYVFDGLAVEPYSPQSLTEPQSVYGRTKLEGEQAVIREAKKHVIIRTAWVFSEYGHNFVKTMVRLAQEHETLSVVADQYGCPTYAGDLATAILAVVKAIKKDISWSKYGVYHFCGEEATSWHGFARAIISRAYSKSIICSMPAIVPISSADYPTPAQRPQYSVMDCSSFPVKGIERNWHRGIDCVLSACSKT